MVEGVRRVSSARSVFSLYWRPPHRCCEGADLLLPLFCHDGPSRDPCYRRDTEYGRNRVQDFDEETLRTVLYAGGNYRAILALCVHRLDISVHAFLLEDSELMTE